MQPKATATRVRYLVVAAATLMSLLLYLDRFCISFAETYIREDLGLSDVQVGWMLSAFFWTYALGQVPCGRLADRWGARWTLSTYILAWSLFTALTGWVAHGFVGLMALRFGFGLAQAGAYPASGSLVSKWIPLSQRGSASGCIAVGGRVGGMLALALTGFLILQFVPLSTSSLLAPADLRDTPRLAHELNHETGSGDLRSVLARRILGGLSSETRAFLDAEDRRYSDQLQRADQEAQWEWEKTRSSWRRYLSASYWTSSFTATTPKPVPKPVVLARAGAEQIQRLADELNELIQTPDLFDPDLLAGVSVEREARRLAKIPRDPARTARLNRLVLESVHRDSIRRVYGGGWRQMMVTFGSMGLLVAGIFWLVVRDEPARHPWCNAGERDLITTGRPRASVGSEVGRIPLRRLLTSRSMWLCCLAQWCTNVGWVFLLTWLPRYLERAHSLPVERRGLWATIPTIVGWLGMVGGGICTDRLVKLVGIRWARTIPLSASRFLAMVAYLFLLTSPRLELAIAALAIVGFATDFGTAPTWAFVQDVGGKQVGAVLGWGNMWGNLGAAIAPPFLIWVVGPTYNWNAAFITSAVAFLLAGVAALGIDASKPIDK